MDMEMIQAFAFATTYSRDWRWTRPCGTVYHRKPSGYGTNLPRRIRTSSSAPFRHVLKQHEKYPSQPSPAPPALRSTPNRQQVEFHEVFDNVPTHYRSIPNTLPGKGYYTVNNATQHTDDTTVTLSNNTFYTPKPSEDRNIFNVLTTPPPRVTPLMINHHPQKLGRVAAAVIRTIRASYDGFPSPDEHVWQL